MAPAQTKKTAPRRGGRPAKGSAEACFGATGLVDAFETGERITALLALRRHIAERLEAGVPARDLAALSLRLMQVVAELDALGANDDDKAKPTAEDELARRRADVLKTAGVTR